MGVQGAITRSAGELGRVRAYKGVAECWLVSQGEGSVCVCVCKEADACI